MITLHPFMPFLTEEIWQQLRERKPGDDCMLQRYPATRSADESLIQAVEAAKDIITKIRDQRNQNQIKPRDPLSVMIQSSDSARALLAVNGLQEMLVKLAALGDLAFTEEEPANAKSFISGTDKFYIVLNQEIDAEAECAKLKQDLEYQLGFTRSIEAKLSNERFVSGAPAQVVDNERKKLADGLTRIQILRESLAKLGCS